MEICNELWEPEKYTKLPLDDEDGTLTHYLERLLTQVDQHIIVTLILAPEAHIFLRILSCYPSKQTAKDVQRHLSVDIHRTPIRKPSRSAGPRVRNWMEL